tara:strand:+ start:62123 stop:63661 length:1539 start_codon:yes stop_codon:yes gene_type:complete
MLLRFTASADNTIVNAYQQNLRIRGTGSNAGMADVVEVFSIYGRQTPQTPTQSGSQELSRYLVKFPISEISASRMSGMLPEAGKVSFYLRMFNAQTSKTVPIDYKLGIHKITQEWQEGIGLDLEGYKDLVKGNIGSDWIQRKKGANWTTVGGAYASVPGVDYFEQYFENGLEDMEVDVTPLVEQWLDPDPTSSYPNFGLLVKLTSSQEAYFSSSTGLNSGSVIHNPDGATTSYYTKRFFARGSQYYFKRPTLEARWDSALRDDRGSFYFSSSRAPAADNLNTLYFYNIVRGRLVNLPAVGTGSILVSFYSGSVTNEYPSGSKLIVNSTQWNVTGGYVSPGIYSCSVAIASSSIKTLYDVWHSGSVQYYTGSIVPQSIDTGDSQATDVYYMNITNLQEQYSHKDTVRLNLYVRNKDWQPTIYTVANNTPMAVPIVSASYRVYRLLDGYSAIPYGTGSDKHTVLSYDTNGNYFKCDMRLLEPGYDYGFKFAFYDEVLKSWVEQAPVFKFKVVEL